MIDLEKTIADQSAEIKQLRNTISELKQYADLLERERSKAEMECADKDAEIARLREALEQIADMQQTGWNWVTPYEIARQTLSQVKGACE